MDRRESPVEDNEILSVLDSEDSPVITNKELADELGYSGPGMEKRMKRLLDAGKVKTRVASGVRLYWLPADT